MASKYMVYFKNYGDAIFELYQTNTYLKMIFKVLFLKKKYEYIDIQIRN